MLAIIIDFVVLPALILLPLRWAKKGDPRTVPLQIACWLLYISFVFFPVMGFLAIAYTATSFMGVGHSQKINSMYRFGLVLFILDMTLMIGLILNSIANM